MRSFSHLLKRLFSMPRYYPLTALTLIGGVAVVILYLLHLIGAYHWTIDATASIAILLLISRLWHIMRHGSYGLNALPPLALGFAIALQQYELVLALVGVAAIEELMKTAAIRKTLYSLHRLIKHQPEQARAIRNRRTVELKLNDLHTNDTIVILPGELIPADALVTGGMSHVSEAILTGELQPIQRTVGDTVLAGSTNGDATLTAKVIRLYQESVHARLRNVVRGGLDSQAPWKRVADGYGLSFTCLALAVGSISWVLSRSPVHFLAVLTVATPYPLIGAVPLVIAHGMSGATQTGIYIRGAAVFERCAKLKTMVFDAASGLLFDQPAVETIIAYGTLTKPTLRAFGRALTQHTHPGLKAALAKQPSAVKMPRLKHATVESSGLTAHFGNKNVLGGTLAYLEAHGVNTAKLPKVAGQNRRLFGIAIDGQLAGAIIYRESLSTSLTSLLQFLHTQHITVLLLRPSASPATKLTRRGTATVVMAASTADKLQVLDEALHPAAVVGTGEADASLLTAAEVSMTLNSRDRIHALDISSVTSLRANVSAVQILLKLARRTFRLSLWLAMGGTLLSLIGTALLAIGSISPFWGVALQALIICAVTVPALLPDTLGITAGKLE